MSFPHRFGQQQELLAGLATEKSWKDVYRRHRPVKQPEGGIRLFEEGNGADRSYLHLGDGGKLLTYYYYNGYDTAIERKSTMHISETTRDQLLSIAETLPNLGISSIISGYRLGPCLTDTEAVKTFRSGLQNTADCETTTQEQLNELNR